MDKCLIIARYNENLDWLTKYNDFKILVYNKGEELDQNYNFKV